MPGQPPPTSLRSLLQSLQCAGAVLVAGLVLPRPLGTSRGRSCTRIDPISLFSIFACPILILKTESSDCLLFSGIQLANTWGHRSAY